MNPKLSKASSHKGSQLWVSFASLVIEKSFPASILVQNQSLLYNINVLEGRRKESQPQRLVVRRSFVDFHLYPCPLSLSLVLLPCISSHFRVLMLLLFLLLSLLIHPFVCLFSRFRSPNISPVVPT